MDIFKNKDKLKTSQLVTYDIFSKQSAFILDNKLISVKPEGKQTLDNIEIVKKTFDNDRYKKYKVNIKTQGEVVILDSPSEREIMRLKKDHSRYIETYDDYIQNTSQEIQNQNLTWIYNILDKKEEMINILFENDHFVLLPDFKWTRESLDDIYLLAIVKRRDLGSIRDLTDNELPMLQDIYDNGLKVLQNDYSVDQSQVRVYLHYHPTYWHLHVHFNLLKNSYNGSSMDVCHSLIQVIENIKLCSNYYQRMPLESCKA